ncbi:hypothetical protein [Leekyejoonella antrihumi]|nr:hypothetical protein [Leekyejoonella antrihumi]
MTQLDTLAARGDDAARLVGLALWHPGCPDRTRQHADQALADAWA